MTGIEKKPLMLKVLFFAQIRERLDCASLELDFPADGIDVDTLLGQLCQQHGALWQEILTQDNIIRAVNQSVVEGSPPLQDGDEVAFFPPVTGG